MQFCHWCSKKIKQGRFCGSECLQAAAEMPELINKQPIHTPVKVASKRRVVLGVIGATALIGGLVAAMWPAPKMEAPSLSVAPMGCVMQHQPILPEPIVEPILLNSKAPVSAFIFTNTTVAKTSEIDALVQSTLPTLQSLYGDMILDTNDGSAPSGVLQLNFLIGLNGEVKWVSRTGVDFVPSLDSAAIKALHSLSFGALPVTTLGHENENSDLEVKVIYRFGEGNNKPAPQQDSVLPYYQHINR